MDAADLDVFLFPTCPEPTWSEVDRLAALERYAILDSGREAAFDDVAELAADILDAPIAVVNFIAADRQWFKAERGIGKDTLPLDVSICRHAILQRGVVVIPDLAKDARFDGNPLVHAADGLRFYAGALLETPTGLPLGTVCVLDTDPRPAGISARQQRALRALAAQTMTQLELRRSNAAALQESDRLSAMFAQATVGMSELRLDGRFLTVNDTLCAMLGRSREELLTLCMVDVTHPDDVAESRSMFDRMIETGANFSLDKRYVRPEGAIVWANSSVTRLLDEAGRPRAALAVTADLTARRDSEATQAFLLSVADALRSLKDPVEIASTAAQRLGERFNLNRVFYAEIFGTVMKIERDYTNGVSSLVGEHDLASFGPDLMRAYHECPVVKVEDVQTDPRFSEEARAGLRSRQVGAYFDVVLFEEERWVSLLALQSATPRTWSTSEENLFREVGQRVKAAIERARAEERLRELNETLERRVADALAERRLLADLVEGTDAFVQVVDFDYRWLAINKAAAGEFARIYGVRPKVGDSMLALLDDKPEHQAAVKAVWGRALAGEEFTEVGEFGDPGLDRRYYEMKYNVLRDAADERIGAYQFVYDVTQRVTEQRRLAEAEEALRQAQKMEAMGQLTGGVAHDFNNLLTPIVGSLDMLQRKGLGGEREQRLIAGAAQSAERAKTLVQRLLAFARRQPLQPVAVDIATLVSGMGDLVASTTGPQIEVVVTADTDLPPAKADPNQLEMALLNLAVNARDAMPSGGTLRISATAETVGRGHRSGLTPGGYLKLSVADTGVGMDEATLARAVEPFFSTKGVGKGTGLGLSMVHGLASQLGGALTIQSRPKFGTNIELWLPESGEVPKEPEQSVPAHMAVRRGTALLVDDEELVRMSTADMLGDLGYVVVEAASGEEAMRIIEGGERFDLLLTDHLMAGITGTDLARSVRAAFPDVPVLLVSGYAENEGVDADLPRLTKPFRKDELASSLAQLTPSC